MRRRANRHRAIARLLFVACLIGMIGANGAGCSTAQPSVPAWSIVFSGLPGALVSVWGSSTRDVWAVGGDPGDGTGPFVLHFDGSSWARLHTGATGDLWWVFGFAGGPVFLGGRGGQILRYQGGTFEPLTTPGTATVFGIWGTSPSDVWAVGGDGTQGAFAWRFDAASSSWSPAPGFPGALAATASLFKVWGSLTDDVWLVGSGGTILHWDGVTFATASSGTTLPLFTVNVAGGRAAAVGGSGSAVLLENEGAGWIDVAPPGTPQLIGVSLLGTGEGWAVGLAAAVMHRTAAGWQAETTGLDVSLPFHGVWVDPDGGVWAAGGHVLDYPLVAGVLVHKGSPVPGGAYRP